MAQNSFSSEGGLERNTRVLAREQKGARDLKPENPKQIRTFCYMDFLMDFLIDFKLYRLRICRILVVARSFVPRTLFAVAS